MLAEDEEAVNRASMMWLALESQNLVTLAWKGVKSNEGCRNGPIPACLVENEVSSSKRDAVPLGAFKMASIVVVIHG